MEDAEEVLKRGMVATITGTRPAVFIGEVEATLYSMFDLQLGDFTVHLHQPEDFLIIFTRRQTMDHIAGDHYINGANFTLLL